MDGGDLSTTLRVLLLGPLPPPVGGVSMHVRRLRDRLASTGAAVEVADDGARSAAWMPGWLAWRLLRHRRHTGALVHVQSGNWRTRALAAWLGARLGLPTVVTLHSFRALDNPRTQRLARLTLRHAAALVAVNGEIRGRCLEYGADPARILVQHAYLDPAEDAPPALPEPLESFIAARSPLLTASAFRLRFHQGLDLYGLDLLIELMAGLRKSLPEAGLLFLLPEAGLPEHLAACRRRITELGLKDRFLIWTEALAQTAVLPRADLLLRPTTTDGDSLSLREALFLGCRVLASDAVARPAGVALFRSRELDDLQRATLAALKQPKPAPLRGADAWPALSRLYAEVLRGR
jgi:glycosyltransferase involved in cell wall biosynthesis